MIVAKKISVEAGHWLPDYPGKCSRQHGHRWVIELAVEGEVGEASGMVVDFTHLKCFLGCVEEAFDHTNLNDTIPNPTAENICLYIEGLWNSRANPTFFSGCKLRWIKVWETEDSYVMFGG